MQRFIVFCLALLIISPAAAQDWVDVDLGVGGTFEVSCQVLTSSMRDDDGQELSTSLPLWVLLMLMGQSHVAGDEEQMAEHNAIWDTLSEARESCEPPVPSSVVTADTLTVRHEVWSAPDGDVTLVDMVVSSESSCYPLIDFGRDEDSSLTDRMYWRQEFIDICI